MSSKYGGGSNRADEFIARLIASVIIVAAVPLVMTLIWGLLHFFGGGTRWPYEFDRWEQKNWFVEGWNFLGGTPALWIFFAVLALVLIFVWVVGDSADDIFPGMGLLFALVFVACFIPMLQGIVSADKVTGQYYAQNTTFYVPDLNKVPSAISRAAQNGKQTPVPVTEENGVKMIKSAHDVPGVIKQGVMPDWDGLWTGRTSSYNGAKTVLASQTANMQGADMFEPGLTYLGGEKQDDGRWTAPIDGSGAYTPAKGVVEWQAATGKITKCEFKSGYRFNRSFGGAKKNSLSHWILSKYTGYFYEDRDVWGYCESGTKPVFVVPMKKRVPFHHQAMETPAGVLIIKGSTSGDPELIFKSEVKRGELAGPVVPASILEKQREALDWMAGRKFRKNKYGNGGFGFDSAKVESNLGNDADFRLYNNGDKRWYYVTPLTPNNPRSQTYTAQMVVATDTVRAGELPAVKVYVPADGTAVPNADQLLSQALTYLGSERPGFTTAKGELRELVPLGGDMWRVYGEVKGYTTDYIDISATGRVTPKVVTLNNTPGMAAVPGLPVQPSGKPGTPVQACGKPIAQMKTDEKVACIKALTDDLAKRQGGTPR